MKIKAQTDYSGNKLYSFPLGSVDRHCIHIGSITLDRNGNGGQISEAQAKTILAEAIALGTEIIIKFKNVEIVLKG